MGHIFTGTHRHKVDGKGRVSIPADFRSVLQTCDPEWTDGLNPTVFIHFGPPKQRHLVCYTNEALQEIDANIKKLRRGSQQRRKAQAAFLGLGTKTTVDETGRLVLSAALREKAGLTDQVVFAGRGDTFEVWNPAAYDAEMEVYFDEEEDLDALDLLEAVEIEIEKMGER